jgi:GT2 family glycosyltransferase
LFPRGKLEKAMSTTDQHLLVSVVIPTINNCNDLLHCLSSIRILNYPKNKIEVIIWDNGSKDGSQKKIKHLLQEMAVENYFNLRLVESDENLGVYTSRDELLKRVDVNAEYILSLDDDVVLPNTGLSEMLKVFDLIPNVGIVGPRVVYFDYPEDTQHGAGFVNLWLGKYGEIDSCKLIECDYTIGCCQLIRKEVVNCLGGFDRDYYTSHGEVDFCLRAKKAGYKIIYNPKIVVKHKVARGGTRTKERLYYLYRNKLFLIKKNAAPLQKLTSLPLYTFFWLPKIILDSLLVNKGINAGEIKVILKAIYHGIIGKVGKQEI